MFFIISKLEFKRLSLLFASVVIGWYNGVSRVTFMVFCMRAKISRNDLFSALNHSVNIVDRKPAIPILSYVLLEFSENTITFKATDLEHSLIETAIAEVDTFGSVAVCAQTLHDVVRKIKDDAIVELSLTEKGTRIQIKAEKAKFEINTLQAEDFPKFDSIKDSSEFVISMSDVKNMIERTKFAMAQEETHYNLNGILFSKDSEGKIVAVSTDRHRLAICKINMIEGYNPIGILSKKTVLELKKLLDGSRDENMKITKNEGQVQFSLSNVSLTARIVDAEFPNYEAVIPEKDESSFFEINRVDFLNVIDRVAVISEDKTRSIKLRTNNNLLHISSSNVVTGGVGQDEIYINSVLNAEWEASFNARYLLDIASALSCEKLKIYVKDRLSSILVIPIEEKEDCMFVVMPMRG